MHPNGRLVLLCDLDDELAMGSHDSSLEGADRTSREETWARQGRWVGLCPVNQVSVGLAQHLPSFATSRKYSKK